MNVIKNVENKSLRIGVAIKHYWRSYSYSTSKVMTKRFDKYAFKKSNLKKIIT